MEALSPRSTNQMIKPKTGMERKVLDKNTAAAAQKAASSKNHAPPPPSIVVEPDEDGERYLTGAFLGKGGFAVCYEGTLSRNRRLFAMKVVKSEMGQKKMEEKFRTELQIHSKMRHPHIVQFHRAFAFERSTYVILELCPNGSVMDMVKKRKALSVPEVRRLMVQLCGAVKYLHKRNVAHRDLKMGNLFLDRNMDIKVGDFGLAAIIVSEKDEKRRRTLCGTPNYIAPEVIDKSKGGHTQKVDIWSLGVICFAMLTGLPPFQSKTQEEIYKKVRNLAYVWPNDPESANHIPEEAKTLVSSCLNLSEDERPDPDDIVEHPFFNMYDGCIPRQLDPACRFAKPVWLKSTEPRGDQMILGYSLEYDERLLGYIDHVDDPSQRYHSCKAAFYSLCGVGRKPDGTARRATGKNCSKSAYAECIVEEERGLQPVVPLPDDYLYKYPHDLDGDWSAPEPAKSARRDDSSIDNSSVLSEKRSVSSSRNPGSLSRTQAALVAAQQRRKESQSHAASLRQQALTGRGSVRKIPGISDLPGLDGAAIPEIEGQQVGSDVARARGFAQRPIRTKRGVAVSYSGPIRNLETNVAPQIPKSASANDMLTVGKTRSQSRRLEAASLEKDLLPSVRSRAPSTTASELPPRRQPSSRTASRTARDSPKEEEQKEILTEKPREDIITGTQRSKPEPEALSRSGSTTTSSGSKQRSTLGAHPLFHIDDPCEVLPGTSVDDVNADLRHMLASLVPSPSSRRRTKRSPHSYVIKWVDYTNRYGIGYVLDDGSVGCVFRAENGQPATGVIVRGGEKHIRRKARGLDNREDGFVYSEVDQLVPRNGRPVEFYEYSERGASGSRAPIRRALIAPSVFEVKGPSSGSSGSGVKVRTNLGVDCARADAEKIKRVKLVDQFGKYMIGSLGRHGDDGFPEDELASGTLGQFIKFYQRLGNVGVWGFGDGAFQFNFPDHTKLVMSPGRTRSSSPWIDFYHLSASAARYLATRGKMHPSGFDTRAVASEEVSTFLSIAHGLSPSTGDERLRDMLEANSFLQKISFIKEVLRGWIKHGRLGGRPSSANSTPDGRSAAQEIFWEGAQERPQSGGSGGKFVWVTVGAPGGDGEYRSVSLKDKEKRTVEIDHDREVDALKEKLRALGRQP